jgi:hypothetical protein
MIEGSCHCKTVTWSFSDPIDGVTACNCTLCSRYGALWVYGHVGHGITVSGTTSSYARGSKINNYHFCTHCGCVVYYASNSKDEQGRIRAALNLRTSNDPKQVAHFPIDHFDGLDEFIDLPRDSRCVKDLWF